MRQALDRFFFQFSAPRSVAAFRIMFGFTFLVNVILRMVHTDFYFSDSGTVTAADSGTVLQDFFKPAFTWAPQTIESAWVMQGVLVLAILILILGVFGRTGIRLTALVAYVCHLGLVQRNYTIVYGADIVTTFWLFSLCLLDSTEAWSVRAWLARRKGRVAVEPLWSQILTSVGGRLVQIQLCVIYIYTGFEKLKGPDWWDQTAVWKVLGNDQLMTADFSFLRSVPLVIGLATWGTVLFEIYGPVFFWVPRVRKWALLAGCMMHIGIAMTMGLFIFSGTMMSAYWLFWRFDRPVGAESE